jgi:hypothetical protein
LRDRAQTISWAIALRDNPNFFQSRNSAHLLLQGSRASKDPAVIDCIQQVFRNNLFDSGVQRSNNLLEFVDRAHIWLQNHPTNKIEGLDQFQRDYSSGTTQSFDSFYWRHRQRRMRCFVGEYFYHLKTWISTNTPWGFITESDPLTVNDALIISVPFCDTGNQIDELDSVLSRCDQLGIPVLVDCCYYTISSGVNINLIHSCIDTVAFSLSKAFPVANLRIGVRYTKPGIYDGQYLMNSIGYNNSLSALVGLKIIENFDCTYIYNTYRQRQLSVCNYFELQPSQSVIFAIGNSQWNIYNRNNLLQTYQLDLDADQFCNRLCLVSIFDNWDLFELVKNETIS